MGDVDWIGLAQDRDRWRALVNSVLSLRVPQNAGKLSSVLTTGGLSSGAQLRRVGWFSLILVPAKWKRINTLPLFMS
jgi:hypothetical protein